MRNPYYILNKAHELVPCDLLTWAEWLENFDNRMVAQTKIGPLLLFETMVFAGDDEREIYRCSTWEQALKVHNGVVAFLNIQSGTDAHAH